MVIDWDVPITMDDGLVLRADVFRPDGPGRYPVLLTYGPYAKGLAFQDGYADQWRHMVAEHPDVARGSRHWYDKQVTVVQHGVGDNGPRSAVTGEPVAGPETLTEDELRYAREYFGEQIASRPLDGEFYRDRSAHWDLITVPLLTAANWGGQGLHTRGNFEGFTRAASAHKWLEVHGLEHWTHFYTDYGVDLQKRFFACFLHGDDGRWRDQPAVQLQVRALGGF